MPLFDEHDNEDVVHELQSQLQSATEQAQAAQVLDNSYAQKSAAPPVVFGGSWGTLLDAHVQLCVPTLACMLTVYSRTRAHLSKMTAADQKVAMQPSASNWWLHTLRTHSLPTSNGKVDTLHSGRLQSSIFAGVLGPVSLLQLMSCRQHCRQSRLTARSCKAHLQHQQLPSNRQLLQPMHTIYSLPFCR